MSKIAVMGDQDSIYGFAALGLEIHPTTDRDEAAHLLKKLANTDYAVIYMTEALAAELSVTPQAKMDNRYDKNINYHGAEGMLEILI